MDHPYSVDAPNVVLRIVNHVPAMIAYWDHTEKCVFANFAYQDWFGRSAEQMPGISLEELLGPLYAKNLPFIRGALGGARQVFERRIALPSGEFRDSIATYTPDVVDGVVRGFSVHVADITRVRNREAALRRAVEEAIPILANTKRSFQSKEIGQLRERLLHLTQILGETNHDGLPAASMRSPPNSP